MKLVAWSQLKCIVALRVDIERGLTTPLFGQQYRWLPSLNIIQVTTFAPEHPGPRDSIRKLAFAIVRLL